MCLKILECHSKSKVNFTRPSTINSTPTCYVPSLQLESGLDLMLTGPTQCLSGHFFLSRFQLCPTNLKTGPIKISPCPIISFHLRSLPAPLIYVAQLFNFFWHFVHFTYSAVQRNVFQGYVEEMKRTSSLFFSLSYHYSSFQGLPYLTTWCLIRPTPLPNAHTQLHTQHIMVVLPVTNLN